MGNGRSLKVTQMKFVYYTNYTRVTFKFLHNVQSVWNAVCTWAIEEVCLPRWNNVYVLSFPGVITNDFMTFLPPLGPFNLRVVNGKLFSKSC